MNIAVLCEYSNIVSQAFRDKGHYVLSCDFEKNSCLQANHYIGDLFDILQYDWDMIICHYPCTFLANAQIWRLRKDNDRLISANISIAEIDLILNSKCPRICIENPIGFLNNNFRKPNIITNPKNFGSPYSKDVCFWTKGLPPLINTCLSPGLKKVSNHVNSRMSQDLKSKIKSKFFAELAFEMANQWG